MHSNVSSKRTKIGQFHLISFGISQRYFTLHPNERDVNPTNVIPNFPAIPVFWNKPLSLFHLFTFFCRISVTLHVHVCVISRIEFKPISIVSSVRGSIVIAAAFEMQNHLQNFARAYFWKITIGSFVNTQRIWNRFMWVLCTLQYFSVIGNTFCLLFSLTHICLQGVKRIYNTCTTEHK